MNSFRFLQRGIEAELERQRALVAAGGTVEQETLHFDPASGSLTSLRSKEEAHDYRYFPEPDLVPIAPERGRCCARPARRCRSCRRRGSSATWARASPRTSPRTLAGDPETAAYFDAAVAGGAERRRAAASSPTGSPASWRGDAAGRATSGSAADSKVDAGGARRPGRAWSPRRRSPTAAARPCWRRWSPSGGDPARDRRARGPGADGLGDDGELAGIVAAAIAADPAAAEQVRAGNGKAIGALVGAVMRETKGRADGGEVTRLLREQLGI